MAYDEGLATRVREAIGDRPGLAEQQMFGGLALLVQGNMACGVRGEDLIVRLAADAAESVQGEPGVRPYSSPPPLGCNAKHQMSFYPLRLSVLP